MGKVNLKVRGRKAVKTVVAEFKYWDSGHYNEVAKKREWKREWTLIPRYTMDAIVADGGVEALASNGSAGVVLWEAYEKTRRYKYGEMKEHWNYRGVYQSFKGALDFIRERAVGTKYELDR